MTIGKHTGDLQIFYGEKEERVLTRFHFTTSRQLFVKSECRAILHGGILFIWNIWKAFSIWDHPPPPTWRRLLSVHLHFFIFSTSFLSASWEYSFREYTCYSPIEELSLNPAVGTHKVFWVWAFKSQSALHPKYLTLRNTLPRILWGEEEGSPDVFLECSLKNACHLMPDVRGITIPIVNRRIWGIKEGGGGIGRFFFFSKFQGM